jgi:hypothetical protein
MASWFLRYKDGSSKIVQAKDAEIAILKAENGQPELIEQINIDNTSDKLASTMRQLREAINTLSDFLGA